MKKRKTALRCYGLQLKEGLELSGRGTITVRGATKEGKGQEHEIVVSVSECQLRWLAKQIRDEFKKLRDFRASVSERGLAIFKEDAA